MKTTLILCAAAVVILPSCGHTDKSGKSTAARPGLFQRVAAAAQKYGVGVGLRVGWKDGGPYLGFQILPASKPSATPPSSAPSLSLDPADHASDALASPGTGSGKTPAPVGPLPL